jgi:hypothetical protein
MVVDAKTPTKEVTMAIIQSYVFSWKQIEADSDLNRLRLVLSALHQTVPPALVLLRCPTSGS